MIQPEDWVLSEKARRDAFEPMLTSKRTPPRAAIRLGRLRHHRHGRAELFPHANAVV